MSFSTPAVIKQFHHSQKKFRKRMLVFFTLAYLYAFALPKEFEQKLEKNNDFSSEIFSFKV